MSGVYAVAHRLAVPVTLQLERDLQAILKGAVPRKYGEMPAHLGKFSRICPGSVQFDKAMKLKRTYFRSHRDRAAYETKES